MSLDDTDSRRDDISSLNSSIRISPLSALIISLSAVVLESFGSNIGARRCLPASRVDIQSDRTRDAFVQIRLDSGEGGIYSYIYLFS